MAGWQPGDEWPDSTFEGGAINPAWSGYIRFFLQAQIAPGAAFVMGESSTDQLNKGNVLSQPGGLPVDARTGGAQQSGLWVDLTCDLVDCEITLGSSSQAGILSKVEAGTLTATLYDPYGVYDPLNPSSPYSLNRQTRLVPGVPMRAFCEVIFDNAGIASANSVTRVPLFTGTADSWREDWTTDPSDRFAKVVATDTVKNFTRMDKPEASPQGANENVANRLTRIVNYYGWTGTVAQGLPYTSSGQVLQATTLAQSAWELVNRTLDDELGFVYFIPTPPTLPYDPQLRWYNRDVWDYAGGPKIVIGCGETGTGSATSDTYDIATDVQPASFDELLLNSVYAARSGGTQQAVQNAASVDHYGESSLQRTDLGLNTDAQVATWAQLLVDRQSYPQTSLDHVELMPATAVKPWRAWAAVLSVQLPTSVMRVRWDRLDYVADVTFRPVGWKHSITADEWRVEWQTVTVSTVPAAGLFHVGQHAQDALDNGYMMG